MYFVALFIKKNKKYGLAFDEKPAWREKKCDYKKNMNYGLAFDEKRGCKKIWIRKNIKKNEKYGLAFDKKRGWGRKEKGRKKEKKKEKIFDLRGMKDWSRGGLGKIQGLTWVVTTPIHLFVFFHWV